MLTAAAGGQGGLMGFLATKDFRRIPPEVIKHVR
jgi:hypothetical protein